MPRTLTSVADGTLATAATWHATKAITVVNQGTKTFTVAGDQSSDIRAGDSIVVAGSTGNNGTYTVVSSTFTTVTAIVVSQSIPDTTADGTLRGRYVPTTEDSIVLNTPRAVSVAASVTLNSISGTGTLTINASRVVTATSCSLTAVTVNGTLTGSGTLTITAGTVTLGGGSVLGGNVDVRGGTITDAGAGSTYTISDTGTVRFFTSQTLATAYTQFSNRVEVYATLTLSALSGAGSASLRTRQASIVLGVGSFAIGYSGPVGSSSFRMGI